MDTDLHLIKAALKNIKVFLDSCQVDKDSSTFPLQSALDNLQTYITKKEYSGWEDRA
jgi:hypothetical protein